MSKLGYVSARAEEAAAKAAERLNAKVARNDALFANADFRDLLDDVAARALLLKPALGLAPECQAAALALRDLVCGLVVNSSRGATWLRDYAARAAVKPKPENTHG